MSSVTPFVRQLGYQSGVQLNELIDNSDTGMTASNTDQIFGLVGRFTRGRIDRSFYVDGSNLKTRLGPFASILLNPLNEAQVQAYETLQNGGFQGVISRLVPAAAVNSYMVFSLSTATPPVGSWTTSPTVPVSAYALLVQHLECFNDGVTVQVNALPNIVAGSPAATSMVRLQLIDNQTGLVLNNFDFTGSLNPASVDENGMSNYLPNVVSSRTDAVVVQVGASVTSIAANVAFYGSDVNGNPLWNSANLNYFSEGGTTYAPTDYDAALNRLRYGTRPFGYLISGGTSNTTLLSKLIALGDAVNVQVAWDIPGNLTPTAALAFYATLNISTRYSQCYWAPLQCVDPVNGGLTYLGTAGVNVGYRCARNARTDANGLPPKNFPVAGINFPLQRVGIKQTYTPTDVELSSLAQSRINPTIFVAYTTGGKYVFQDSLTGANSTGGSMLINVTEMATANDTLITQYGQQCLQLPMKTGIKRMNAFLKALFNAEISAEWIKASTELAGSVSLPTVNIGNAAVYTVQPNAARPNDRMDVSYAVHYDGTVRAIYVQQTLSR